MPGTSAGFLQSVAPVNSAVATGIIPSRQLWEPQTGTTGGAMINGGATALNILADVGTIAGSAELAPPIAAGAGIKLGTDITSALGQVNQALGNTNSSVISTAAATQADVGLATAAASVAATQATSANTAATEAASGVNMLLPSPGQTFSEALGDLLVNVGYQSIGTWGRYLYNPNVWVHLQGGSQAAPGVSVSINDWSAASPSDNLGDESDVDMLNRLYTNGGTVTWSVLPFLYGGLPFVSVDNGTTFELYVYQPVSEVGVGSSSIVRQFYHLWDYVPGSGPPHRNGIDDFIAILSTLPFQWQ